MSLTVDTFTIVESSDVESFFLLRLADLDAFVESGTAFLAFERVRADLMCISAIPPLLNGSIRSVKERQKPHSKKSLILERQEQFYCGEE